MPTSFLDAYRLEPLRRLRDASHELLLEAEARLRAGDPNQTWESVDRIRRCVESFDDRLARSGSLLAQADQHPHRPDPLRS